MMKSLSFHSSQPQKKKIAVVPHVIKGKDVVTKKLEPVYSHQNTSKKIHDFAALTNLEGDIAQLCDDSYSGYLAWSTKSHIERTKILQAAAQNVRNRREDFLLSLEEIGLSNQFAEFNIMTAANHIEEYARNISLPDGTLTKSDLCDLSLIVRNPIGPVYSVAPWNAPLILTNRSLAAPLAAGCSVLLKSSEKAPLVAYFLVKCYLDAGVPPKTLQLFHVAPREIPQATEMVISNKHVRKVNFTGSTFVGGKIALTCAKYLKPYLLELGGKNYSIVCKDADIPKAIENIFFSAFFHKGQICMCLDKVFIHDSIYNTFVEKLQSMAKKALKKPDHEVPQRDMVSTTKIHDLVADALNKGAKIIYGEKQDLVISSSGDHTAMTPIILADITLKMSLDTVESFGPVLSLHKFKDENKLIEKANGEEYGLKVSIWSSNVLHALSLAKKIDSGGVHINSSSIHDEAYQPHGGVKSSGCGRFNSSWGIDSFSYIKTITLNQ
ncbi:ALDH-like protein [Hyphopichia burtonii NRRL Y-1933]|uniref:ALDH-like protein n=1 Tax=Hyphopichia burtonii NRRL Y-1933 TaxID=984485 RepID=A0A1E4RCH2_9ASCO|nr:ALDH-like protein [Hyphopichia burtonii NRRL Y-1933]ODV64936.1 ALDH-like protein [Hyphopichia burtonii NRRL Y-1933]